MLHKKRISITILTGLFVEFLNKIAPLVIFHLAQKRLGLEKFGYALFGISVIELVIPFITFGYNQYGTIAAGKDPERIRKLMSNIFVLKFIHLLILLAFLYSFFLFSPNYRIYYPMMLPLGMLLLFSVFETVWVQAASQKVAVSNLSYGVCRFISLILILRFIQDSQDAILFAILSLVSNAIINIFSVGYTFRSFSLVRPDWTSMRVLFKKSQPFAVIALLTIVNERMDIFLAEHFDGLSGAGYYAGCARLGHSLIQIANTIIMAFFSEMVSVSSKESMTAHMTTSLWVLCFFLSPIVFGVWFVDSDLLSFIFDEKFRSVGKLLSLLFLSATFSLITTSFGQQILLLNGQLKSYALALILGIIISFLGTTMAGGGLYAIAISMCIGKSFTSCYVMMAAKKTIRFPIGNILLRTIGPGIIMALGLYFLHLDGFFATLSAGAILYLFSSYWMNRRDFSTFFNYFRRWLKTLS